MGLLEDICSQAEYEKTRTTPSTDTNCVNACFCCSGTYFRCCPTDNPIGGWWAPTGNNNCNDGKAQPCFCGQRQHQVCICCECDSKCHLKMPDMAELCTNEVVQGCCETNMHFPPTAEHPLMIALCGFILWQSGAEGVAA